MYSTDTGIPAADEPSAKCSSPDRAVGRSPGTRREVLCSVTRETGVA
jgi:hypothetical protein